MVGFTKKKSCEFVFECTVHTHTCIFHIKDGKAERKTQIDRSTKEQDSTEPVVRRPKFVYCIAFWLADARLAYGTDHSLSVYTFTVVSFPLNSLCEWVSVSHDTEGAAWYMFFCLLRTVFLLILSFCFAFVFLVLVFVFILCYLSTFTVGISIGVDHSRIWKM